MKKILVAMTAIFALWSSASFALDRRVMIHNHTGKRITELYASPIDEGKWTYNMLSGAGVIYGHDSRVADIDDGTGYCRYDLLAVLADGRKAEKYNVDVCKVTDWHIYD